MFTLADYPTVSNNFSEMKKPLIILLSLGLLLAFGSVWAQTSSSEAKVEVNFFYSETCPHCAAEEKFLDKIEQQYPEVEINRYHFTENIELARGMFEKYGIGKEKFGAVPATFVNDRFILGYGSERTTGAKIEKAVKEELEGNRSDTSTSSDKTVHLPLIGELNTSNYSLPALTVIMGAMDGFNICSLGALVLILGIVLSLRSRFKILLYGGIFLLTTAVIYGFLIVLWYKLFDLLSRWTLTMKFLIGLLGLGGGIYFLREFLKFREYGPTCETVGEGVTSKFSKRIKKAVSEDSTTVLSIVGLILLFAAVIAVVEFPCSAAVPLIYAGILAEADLPALSYLVYVAFFILFYLLDEIIVFGIAVWKMTTWMESPKFVTWMTLVEAVVLLGLGSFYFLKTLQVLL